MCRAALIVPPEVAVGGGCVVVSGLGQKDIVGTLQADHKVGFAKPNELRPKAVVLNALFTQQPMSFRNC